MTEVLAGIGTGTVLADRYELNTILGRGGMAQVWRATDRLLDREVAVKLVDGALDGTARERFNRETRTAAALNHPNIVTVHDAGVTETDLPFLVMELISGQSLAEVIHRGRLSIADILAMARQLCDALQAAHAAGIVHRDIKPGNVLVTDDGIVKVCDFGIASLTRDDGDLTEPGTAVGTAQYMAPEQALSDRMVDHRADLYALGCVIYAMTTGLPPFGGKTPAAIAAQHLHQPVTPLQVRRPDTPASLSELVSELLAKDPAARPASAAEVKDRLELGTFHPAERAQAAEPWRGRAQVATRPQTRPLTAFTTALRAGPPGSRLIWLAAAAVVLIGLAAIVLSAYALRGGNTPETATPGSSSSPASSATPVAANDPAAALAAVQEVVRVRAGGMHEDAVKELQQKTREIGEELDKGKPDKAAEKLRDLQKKLSQLRREGKLSAQDYDALQAPLAQLAAALPAPKKD